MTKYAPVPLVLYQWICVFVLCTAIKLSKRKRNRTHTHTHRRKRLKLCVFMCIHLSLSVRLLCERIFPVCLEFVGALYCFVSYGCFSSIFWPFVLTFVAAAGASDFLFFFFIFILFCVLLFLFFVSRRTPVTGILIHKQQMSMPFIINSTHFIEHIANRLRLWWWLQNTVTKIEVRLTKCHPSKRNTWHQNKQQRNYFIYICIDGDQRIEISLIRINITIVMLFPRYFSLIFSFVWSASTEGVRK